MPDENLWVPRSVEQSQRDSLSDQFRKAASALTGVRGDESPEVAEMRANRRANRKTGALGTQISIAPGRMQGPMEYWRQSNLPYDVWDEKQLEEIRGFCRLLYLTHPIIGSAIDIFCVAGETKVLTREGSREISSLVGDVTRVITKGGKWVEAKFDCFGVDALRKITLTRYGRTKDIFATGTHRWFVEKKFYRKNQVVSREETTDTLQPGDELTTTTPWRNELKKTNPSPFGVAHGFVVGDGSREQNGGCVVDLHDQKDLALIPYFNGCSMHEYSFPEGPCPRVVGLPGYFKDLPSITESAAYLSGWLAGYFAADGTVNEQGQCCLDSSDLENLEFARDVCTRLGVFTYPIYDIGETETTWPDGLTGTCQMYRLNLDSFDLDERFFILKEHHRKWMAVIGGRERELRRANWRVISVEETDRVEPVYCAVVPVTESFVLEDFILTGNSKFPLTDMRVVSKDPELEEFYKTLFIEDLDYEFFFEQILHEYWTCGEAFPYGQWNAMLGIWEDDELIDADDVNVIKTPFNKTPRLEMKLPKTLRDILENREPEWEYNKLVSIYPELLHFVLNDEYMPVSGELMKQIAFRADTFHPRGLPILLRAFRTVYQEEMLMAAQDAIASRLYTPLVLAKLGATAQDTGMNMAWMPSQGDIQQFQDALEAALMADFRVLTYHFGIDMELVFGKEAMPDFTPDFDRIVDRILQTFGMSQTALMGAGCLAGDTLIGVNRAGKGSQMPIELIVRRLANDPDLPVRKWCEDIPTYVAQANGGVSRLGLLRDAWESGIKETVELTTDTRRSIRATAEHPFLTEAGEWVPLGELRVGDFVQVNVLEQINTERIVSIVAHGLEMTYDIGMVEEPHNFLANGFVVHNSGETYAADALNFQLVSMLLTKAQKLLKKFWKDRCMIVAEAQGHYDYIEINGKKYPVMEEVVKKDEETGEEYIEEQPKLLIPDIEFREMSMADEESQSQFIEALVASGVPISAKHRLHNTKVDLEEEREELIKERVANFEAEQQARKEIYITGMAKGYPLPQDIIDDFQPMADVSDHSDPLNAPGAASETSPVPSIGDPAANPMLMPPPGGDIDPETGEPMVPDAMAADQPQAAVIPLPRNRSRPPESDERREDMPKASVRLASGKEIFPIDAHEITYVTKDGERTVVEGKYRLLTGPDHIGRRAKLDKNKPLDDQQTG